MCVFVCVSPVLKAYSSPVVKPHFLNWHRLCNLWMQHMNSDCVFLPELPLRGGKSRIYFEVIWTSCHPSVPLYRWQAQNCFPCLTADLGYQQLQTRHETLHFCSSTHHTTLCHSPQTISSRFAVPSVSRRFSHALAQGGRGCSQPACGGGISRWELVFSPRTSRCTFLAYLNSKRRTWQRL